MFLFISPEWFTAILTAATLILGIATFIQAARTKTLTNVVDELKNQTQRLGNQAQSLQNMVTLMAQDQVTKQIPTLSEAKLPTKSYTYLVKLNNAGGLISSIGYGLIGKRKVKLVCNEMNKLKSPGETFEFQVHIAEYPISKGEEFDFFIHSSGSLGMRFTQHVSLIADKDYNPEGRSAHPVYFDFRFNYPVPLAEPLK